MQDYSYVDISERDLEDLIRLRTNKIEEGLRYVDHQLMTDRGPLDVLLVDSGSALALAELKVVQDDNMLMQGIDYYDYVSRNIEGIARVYEKFDIVPSQPVRLFLIAPTFPVSLLNRCRWIDIPISLFTYRCVRLEGSGDTLPVFSEVTIPAIPKPVEKYSLESHLEYITDQVTRKRFQSLVEEVQGWDSDGISIEPIKDHVSLKVRGKVFSYLGPRRKHFVVGTYDQNKWIDFPIHDDDDLETVKPLLASSVEQQRRLGAR